MDQNFHFRESSETSTDSSKENERVVEFVIEGTEMKVQNFPSFPLQSTNWEQKFAIDCSRCHSRRRRMRQNRGKTPFAFPLKPALSLCRRLGMYDWRSVVTSRRLSQFFRHQNISFPHRLSFTYFAADIYTFPLISIALLRRIAVYFM